MCPMLFILYLSPLENIIKSHGLDCTLYADDTQLYITMNPDTRSSALVSLDRCINEVESFFATNKLSCNATKTEIVDFSSRFSKYELLPSISIDKHILSTSKEARNLGVIFDQHLSMSSHINHICHTASLAIKNIGRIRKYIDNSSAERLVHAFVSSKLDYCNSVLYGLPAK